MAKKLTSDDCKKAIIEYQKANYSSLDKEVGLWKRTSKNEYPGGLIVRTFKHKDVSYHLSVIEKDGRLLVVNAEQLLFITDLAVSNQLKPASDEDVEYERIVLDLERNAHTIRHCGDYGMLYYHRAEGKVVWVASDADFDDNHTPYDEVKRLLMVPGIKDVEIADEWFPEAKDGWEYLGTYGQTVDFM